MADDKQARLRDDNQRAGYSQGSVVTVVFWKSKSVTFGFEAPFKNNGNIKGGAFLIQDSLGLHRAMQNCLESDKSIFFEYWKHRDGEWFKHFGHSRGSDVCGSSWQGSSQRS